MTVRKMVALVDNNGSALIKYSTVGLQNLPGSDKP